MKANNRSVGSADGSCEGFELPASWGQLPPPDPNYKPLTAKDLEGFSESDWEAIKQHMQSK